MMTQSQQVVEVMRKLGGVATFAKLNLATDFSGWKTKTPEATVRRIVQENPAFFKIQPGLWALEECREEIFAKFDLKTGSQATENQFNHSYYQGLILEIGNLRKMHTFVPNQDKNRLFLDKPLKNVASLPDVYPFAYSEILRFAKTVDVIWFNNRKMPSAFFEVEHSTDIRNSLGKFYELQDFHSEFYIIAPEHKARKFDDEINRSIFSEIEGRVRFVGYEKLSEMHTQEHKYVQARHF